MNKSEGKPESGMGETGTAGKMLKVFLGLCLALLLSAPYILFQDRIRKAPALGIAGVFLACALSNAAVFLPTSSTVIVLTASTVLNPLSCILAGGFGAAAGEQVSYLCGRVGLSWIRPDPEKENRILKWLNKNSILTVFLFALAPLPVFDLAGIAAGAAGMKWRHFALAAAAGKVLKFALTVGYVLYVLPLCMDYFPENLRMIFEAWLDFLHQ